MDKISSEQRHKNMAAIHSKNTKPEMVVHKWLWAHGFRYRLNSPRLPGHPDLVLRKSRDTEQNKGKSEKNSLGRFENHIVTDKLETILLD